MTFHVRAGWQDGEAVLLDYRVQADEGVDLLAWQKVIPLTRIAKAAAILGHVDPRDGWQDGWWTVERSLDITDDLAAAVTASEPERRGRGRPRLTDAHHRRVLELADEASKQDIRNVRAYIAQRLRGQDGHEPTNSTVSTWLRKARKWQREQQREGKNNE